MAIKFNQARGSAIKSKIDQYTYKNGDNVLRMVGDILPRYVYWVKGENDKNIPMECLSFDRDTETFNNKEKDYVRDFFPALKCGWACAYPIIAVAILVNSDPALSPKASNNLIGSRP